MAKTRKQMLTQDELLDLALVPQGEQPYDVPENWVWVRLGSIATIVGGGTPSTNIVEYYENGNISWISPADLSNYQSVYISQGRKNITQLGLEKSSARMVPVNTVLLSTRAPIGYVAIAGKELSTNQGFKSFLPSRVYIPKYLYFYFIFVKDTLETYASGTTFLEISASKAAIIEFPLPPIDEQQRIVERIESLFGKLDQAKELIETALDSFKTRRAAILNKAFTGELTAKWREEHGEKYDDWEKMDFVDCIVHMQNGISKRRGTEGVLTVVLRLANISENEINSDDLREIVLNESEASRYELVKDDTLIIRVNGSGNNVGKIIQVRENNGWAFSDHLIKCQFDQSLVLTSFIVYMSMTSYYRTFIDNNIVSSAGQNTISQKSLERFSFYRPSLPEQEEIVRILDSLLEKEQRAHELSDIIQRIETMKKSILARAFRGELGSNDPTEESAMELLAEQLANS